MAWCSSVLLSSVSSFGFCDVVLRCIAVVFLTGILGDSDVAAPWERALGRPRMSEMIRIIDREAVAQLDTTRPVGEFGDVLRNGQLQPMRQRLFVDLRALVEMVGKDDQCVALPVSDRIA